jgi:cyclopropane-fatty-acyl-phospholipid synthase
MLPSIQEMNKVLGSTGLKVDSQFMFGDHYAKTLEYWRGSFDRSWDNIKNMGFNNTFKRMWNYYLSYCQGGFQSGNINVGQFLIKKI